MRPRACAICTFSAFVLGACVERPIVEQEPLTLEEHCELFCEAQWECSNARFSRDPCFEPCVHHREQRPWESEGCYERQRAYQTCIVERGCDGWDDPECDALGRAIDCEPAPSDDD